MIPAANRICNYSGTPNPSSLHREDFADGRNAGAGAWRLLRVLCALSAIIFHGSPVAVAQDFERIAPKTPPKAETPTEISTPAPPAAENGHILVQSLKGLVFVPSADQVQRKGTATVEGVRVQGLPAIESPEFQPVVRKYLGQPVTGHLLSDIGSAVVAFYRARDVPVVDVIAPAGQDITGGVIQFVVLEGRLRTVKVEGNRWVDKMRIQKQVRMARGEPIRESVLTSDLNWINRNPFRQVTPTVARPEAEGGAQPKPGETDLILKVNDRFPVRFYGGYEDSGNDLTGDERLQMGFNWGNAFWQDHQLNYQFTGDSDFDKFTAHSGSYVIPLPWRHILTFFGSYAETKADIANPLFDLKGKSWQASNRYTVPLPTIGNYSHETAAGFDFKQSNNNLEFGGAGVFNTTTEIAQWAFSYNASLRDGWGVTSFENSIFYDPGQWTSRNKDPNFNAARANAKAEYVYGRLTLDRMTKLPEDFSWILKGTYQWSDGNLLGSEQLGVGGYSTVRGYDEREANGDGGYLVSTEVRTPPVSIVEACGTAEARDAKDQLQFLVFWDYGSAENFRLLTGEDPHVLLSSVGPGVRYSITPYLSMRADYGFQLYDTGANTRSNSRWHISAVLSY